MASQTRWLASLDGEICLFTGKRSYPSLDAAEAMLQEIRLQRMPGQKRHKRAYGCNGCGGWHLTSRKKDKR